MGDVPARTHRTRPIGTGLAAAVSRRIRRTPGLPDATLPASETFKPGINVQRYGSFGKRDTTNPEAIVTVTEFGGEYTGVLMDRIVAVLEPHYTVHNRSEAVKPDYMIYHRTTVIVSKKAN